MWDNLQLLNACGFFSMSLHRAFRCLRKVSQHKQPAEKVDKLEQHTRSHKGGGQRIANFTPLLLYHLFWLHAFLFSWVHLPHLSLTSLWVLTHTNPGVIYLPSHSSCPPCPLFQCAVC